VCLFVLMSLKVFILLGSDFEARARGNYHRNTVCYTEDIMWINTVIYHYSTNQFYLLIVNTAYMWSKSRPIIKVLLFYTSWFC
jgi:hypothetical protein